MNEGNFEALLSQLVAIGFPENLESELHLLCFFEQKEITIGFSGQRNFDTLIATACLRKKDDQYFLSHYDVTLRKYDTVPDKIVNTVDLRLLEARMATTAWNGVIIGATGISKLPPEALKEVWQLLQDLKLVETDAEAKCIALQMKMKFWEGTSLETFIPNLKMQKARLEITQRYFNFDHTEGITIKEAFRFLNHRWHEKQFKANMDFNGLKPTVPDERKRKEVKRTKPKRSNP